MRLLLAAGLSLSLFSGCVDSDAPTGESVSIPTPRMAEAQRIRDARGMEAAVPAYRLSVAHDPGPAAGLSAVVLWDHYERAGDAAEAAVYRRAALDGAGDMAWVIWASRPVRRDSTAYDTATLVAGIERLHVGVAAGSSAAREALAQRLDRLHVEAAQGNAAARELLARVRAEGLDTPAGA
jgi:hypothetical protein